MEQPSIQSFYSREVRSLATSSRCPSKSHGPDGFTKEEIEGGVHRQTLRSWQPSQGYVSWPISDLQPGTSRIHITGRVINLYHQLAPSAKQLKPSGFWRLVLKDDSGAVNVSVTEIPTVYLLTTNKAQALACQSPVWHSSGVPALGVGNTRRSQRPNDHERCQPLPLYHCISRTRLDMPRGDSGKR